jgi:hypothetical protein
LSSAGIGEYVRMNPDQVAASGLAHMQALAAASPDPDPIKLMDGTAYPTDRTKAVLDLLGDAERMAEAVVAMVQLENESYAALMSARVGCTAVEQLTKNLAKQAKELKRASKRAAVQPSPNREPGDVTGAKPQEPYLVEQTGFAGWYLRHPSGNWLAVSDRMCPAYFGELWPKVNRLKPGPHDSEVVMKSTELAEIYGKRTDEVVWTMHGDSRFVANPDTGGGTLFMRCAQLDPQLEARYDQEVSDWLALLGGQEGDRLLDWLATCTDLSRPTCALYIRGAKAIGKGMLAAALSRLWGKSKTTYADVVFSGFSSAMRSCPLVHLDETLPKDAKGMGSSAFRTLTGESAHALTEKGRPTATIHGCPRVLVTTNNFDALRLADEDLTREDQEAIAERVLYILADPAAAGLLTRNGTADWVDDGDRPGRICGHIMWLVANWKVKHPGKRLLVEGHGSGWIRQVGWQGTPNSVLVACVRSLSGEESEYDADDRAVLPTTGGVHVRTELLHTRWRSLAMSDRAVPLNSLGRSIARVSPDERTVKINVGHDRVRAWFIPSETLIAYAESSGIGDLDRIRQRLGILAGSN